MSVSGIGQSYYQNNVETTKRAKNVNSTEETNSFVSKVVEKSQNVSETRIMANIPTRVL